MFSAVRASPSESATIAATASGSTSSPRRPRPRSGSPTARRTIVSSSGSVRRSSTYTRQRERSAAITSKDGFSVVAPIRVTVPRSTCGRNASCWALLKRWISSTNRIVRWPRSARRSSASPTRPRTSLMPVSTAENGEKCALACAGHEGGERGLSRARRPPEDHRVEVPRLDGGAKKPPGSEEMRLADVLVEALRPHPLGEGRRLAPTLARRLLEQLHAARSLASRPVVRRRGSRTAARRAAREARARLAQVRMPQRPRATKRSARATRSRRARYQAAVRSHSGRWRRSWSTVRGATPRRASSTGSAP